MGGVFQRFLAALKKPITWVILAVLGAILAWWVTSLLDDRRAREEAERRGQPYVAVIMSRADETFTIPTEFLTGFGAPVRDLGPNELRAANGDPVRIQYLDDNYSAEGARLLARRLLRDRNCALIIGNSNSELTGITLNEILRVAPEDRPALIMPIATANFLTGIARDQGYNAVLRLVPNNRDQAATIRNFVTSRSSTRRVAILVDEENSDYSRDLARDLSANLRQADGQIIYQGRYGDNSRLHSVAAMINQLRPDFIIFVGVSNNGLLLVDDMMAHNIQVPVIFTDGGTVGQLIQRSTRLPAGAFFLSPVRNLERTQVPTYQPIGADTRALLGIIIGQSGSGSRSAIRKFIEEKKGNILLQGGVAGNYSFNESTGENSSMHFSMYQNTGGRLVLVSGY